MLSIDTLIAPELPSHLPKHCQWLSGQGAGAWFSLDLTEVENQYQIKRFSAEGNLDCDRIFIIEDNENQFDISKKYKFAHISHCAKCNIIQEGKMFVFKCLTT
ncbi:MAG: hypothetical protein P1U41_07695 [Vicingaceae bacterium]|nr:hypothetical protein [Vicingaceae bacterium]